MALGVMRRVGFTAPMAWRARLRAFSAGSSLISNGFGFFIRPAAADCGENARLTPVFAGTYNVSG